MTECAEYHRMFMPKEYSPEEWHRIVDDMGRRVSLSEGRIGDLDLYLTASSRAAREER